MIDDIYYKGFDRERLITFIKKLYPKVTTALLTGSHLKKKKRDSITTDIDLVIFSDIIGQTYVEKLTLDSLEYDVICFSTNMNNIIDTLYFDIDSRFGAYRNMMLSSKILIDESNVFPIILRFVQEKGLLEYGTLQNNEVYKYLILISNHLKKIKKLESFEEKYIAFYILENTINLILAYKKSSMGNGIKKLFEFKAHSTELYQDIKNSIENQDINMFKAAIFECVKIFSDPIEDYSPKLIPTITNEDAVYEIVIDKFILKSRFDFEKFLELKRILIKFDVFLDYYYYFNNFLVINYQVKDSNTFVSDLVIKQINLYLKTQSRSYILTRKKRFKLIPYESDEVNGLVEDDLKQIIIFLEKNVLKNKIDRYNLGLILINNIIEILSKEDKENLLNEIILSNICNIYDDEITKFNYNQLVQEYKKACIEIELLSKTLSYKRIDTIKIIRLSFIEFLRNRFNNSNNKKIKPNEFISSEYRIITKYIKLIIDIILPNELSTIANILMINIYHKNIFENQYCHQ